MIFSRFKGVGISHYPSRCIEARDRERVAKPCGERASDQDPVGYDLGTPNRHIAHTIRCINLEGARLSRGLRAIASVRQVVFINRDIATTGLRRQIRDRHTVIHVQVNRRRRRITVGIRNRVIEAVCTRRTSIRGVGEGAVIVVRNRTLRCTTISTHQDNSSYQVNTVSTQYVIIKGINR